MSGGLMQLVNFHYYRQLQQLNNLTDIKIRNKDDSINIEYTERINNIINTIHKKYPKLSLETMRDIIVLYVATTIDDFYMSNYCNNTNIVFYLIKIKDKKFMEYIDKRFWYIENYNYGLTLGYFDIYDYHKHLDNNIKS